MAHFSVAIHIDMGRQKLPDGHILFTHWWKLIILIVPGILLTWNFTLMKIRSKEGPWLSCVRSSAATALKRWVKNRSDFLGTTFEFLVAILILIVQVFHLFLIEVAHVCCANNIIAIVGLQNLNFCIRFVLPSNVYHTIYDIYKQASGFDYCRMLEELIVGLGGVLYSPDNRPFETSSMLL